ncbi:cyclin-like protein [Naematelia encephala]|uniref:Cyclin-like protein n=1 Tax=Naematelia encephala TaxID=71784 RepID=A0A1Y2ACK3_9TREE|nr:cyclin-like protein [Naematelia encephala]
MSSSSQPVVPRRPDDGPYFEEDYSVEIMAYMHSMDALTLASAELMDMQPELQWFMRPYLIDFLIEVHQQFRLRPEVLYLAMNIVDRYVSKRVVYKKHYQLVGCAALWIAAKFEDGKDKVPLVRELAEMCCKAYDESAFIQMEGHVLSTIGWTIGHPSAEAWLRVCTTGVQHEESKVSNTARFLMEITLFHREFVGVQSSVVAAGALMLARYICGKPRKPAQRGESAAVRVSQAIDRHFGEKLESVSEIVVRKYAPTYYGRASTVVREWYLSGRRYVYQPEQPITPMSAGIPTPGLAPSGSWSSKRGSWIAASPSAGSLSCASSDAGDEPLTPVTPNYPHGVDPFNMAAKENINPVYGGAAVAKDAVLMMGKHTSAIPMPVYAVQPSRPALHVLPAELAIPNRTMRRLSN